LKVLIAGNLDGVVQFITVLLIFVFVLVITYFTTKFVGGYQQRMLTTSNIKVIESMRIANNKYLQIVSVGDKTFVIALAKDTVTYIGEVDSESLKFKDPSVKSENFKQILEKVKLKTKATEEDSE